MQAPNSSSPASPINCHNPNPNTPIHEQPKLLAALAAEPEQLAHRLVEFKTLLPQADVASIVSQVRSLGLAGVGWVLLGRASGVVRDERELGCLGIPWPLDDDTHMSSNLPPLAPAYAPLPQRPSLLLDGEWERVPVGVAALEARYSEEEAARLASAEPLLLVEDLEYVLQELGRWVLTWGRLELGQSGESVLW